MKKFSALAMFPLVFCLQSKALAADLTLEELSQINAIQQQQIKDLKTTLAAVQTQLSQMVTQTALNNTLNTRLAGYVTNDSLNTRLNSYPTNDVLTNRLSPYATTSWVNSYFVSTWNLDSRLTSYVTGTELRDKIGKCRIALGHSDNGHFGADSWGDIDWAFDFDRNALKLSGTVNGDDTIFYDFGCFW